MNKNNIINETFNLNDYIPKRFALKYNPPQIIIEYLKPSKNKFYHHRMILHKLNKKKVNPNQIIKLIEKIKINYLSNNENINQKENNNNNRNNINQIIIPKFIEDKNIDFNNEYKNNFEEEYNDFDENISEEDNNEIKKNNNIIGLNNEKDLNHEIYENEWNDDSY